MIKRTPLLSLLFASIFYAKNAFAVDASTPPDFAIGSLIGSLFLVISCIFVFAYLVKKTNLIKNSNNNQLKLISTYALNNKGRVQIIECNGQHYLLGVTEKNINLIDKFDTPIIENNEPSIEKKTPFSAIFSKMNKKNNE